ncbi:hypothetical protein MVEG_03817 [Podila verticillata NRRL 6337]|nr:hypothetical protein MVEG_03817 [Podila verticillata NRRL 6337]
MATETLLYASLVLAPVTRLYVAYNPPTFLQQHIDLRASCSSSSLISFPYQKYHLRRQTIDATYSKHITYSPAHSFTPDVDGHDRNNNYTSPSLVPPPSRLTCILDVSEIHYHGSLAEFDQDDELNTAIHQIQVLTSSSCLHSVLFTGTAQASRTDADGDLGGRAVVLSRGQGPVRIDAVAVGSCPGAGARSGDD